MPIGQALEPRDRPALSRGLRVQDVGFPKIKVLRTKGGRGMLGRHDSQVFTTDGSQAISSSKRDVS